ncbi:DNA primase [Candidatus Peregrinibacteria bacterium]|nr:DNA primase [Candidatus Peregrinibacteria bacterium]
MQDYVEEIKGRLGIFEVVSQYVQLKKAGRNFKGLCPFHGEKTPSFIVSPEKQICHCFGCNKGGDIFTFIQELEGITFPEALEVLAERAGVKIEKQNLKKENKSEKDEFLQAHTWAADFFEKQLWETNDGRKVLEYLHRRGMKDETIREFKIGFAPDKYDGLYPSLLKKGIHQSTLVKSGLVSAKNLAADQVYDKYRARLIFPICDYLGNICGFGGRALKADQMPKYLNSAENVIYSKSKVLFGLSSAKKYIKEHDEVILVEGYFDMVLPFQEGVKNVVATSGTALTKEQVKMLSRLTRNSVSCFDSDEAGLEATKRAFALIMELGMTMKTFAFEKEKDPAEFVVAHGGEAFAALSKSAVDFMEFYLLKVLKANENRDFSGKNKILSEVLPFYKRLSTAGQDFYVKFLARELDLSERAIQDEINNFDLPADHPVNKFSQNDGGKMKFTFSQTVLAVLLAYPALFGKFAEIVDFEILDEDCKSIYKQILAQYNEARLLNGSWDFEADFSSEERQKIDILVLFGDDNCSNFSDVAIVEYVKQLAFRIKEEKIKSALKELQIQIMEADQRGEKEKIVELFERQKQLLKAKF